MIIPAILEKDFSEVEKKIKLLEDTASVVQIDIVDNTIIEGETFLEVEKLGRIRSKSDITLHLMVAEPLKFIKKSGFFSTFKSTKINGMSTVITQLIEDGDRIYEFIKFSKETGYKVGLSINIDQDNSLLQPSIKNLDLVQFMGVIPGKQGNAFIPEVLEKITRFKKDFPAVTTQIDGGVNKDNFDLILKTGVDNIAIGSSIFNTEDPKKTFLEFLERKSAHGTGIYN